MVTKANRAAPPQTTNKDFRIPLVGSFQNRSGTTTKDQRFLNCYIESNKNEVTESKKVFLVKRPGLSLVNTYAAGTSRGLFYWKGNPYVAIGSKLYKNTTEIGTNILTGTSGHVGMEACTTTAFGDCLFVADGTNCFIIKTDGTYVTIPTIYSARANSTAYALGDFVIPATPNGFYYEYILAGTSGGSIPTFPTYIGGQVVDGTAVLSCSGYYGFSYSVWVTATAYTVGARIIPTTSNGYVYECTVAGTTSGTQPLWPQTIGDTVTDGTVTWECKVEENTTTPLPKNHVPYPVYMDGYIFIIAKNSDGTNSSLIYNSDIDNPLSWNQIDYTAAESFPDALVALARQNNVVMAFGHYTTEMFNDAANPLGSPLSRNESLMLQFGCAAPNSIMQQERYVILVGGSDLGGKAVWLIDGYNPKKISDEYIEKIIDAEGSSIENALGYGVRTNGHIFYVLRLSSRTLVYDLEEKMWHEWSYNSSGTHANFLCGFMADDETSAPLLLGATDAKLYHLSPTAYTDNSTSILMDIYTTRYDFESMKRKFMSSLSVVGDQISGDTISIRWSDDDYTTWNTARTPSLTSRTFITNLGAFRRRAFNITYSGSNPYRIEALETEVTLGTH